MPAVVDADLGRPARRAPSRSGGSPPGSAAAALWGDEVEESGLELLLCFSAGVGVEELGLGLLFWVSVGAGVGLIDVRPSRSGGSPPGSAAAALSGGLGGEVGERVEGREWDSALRFISMLGVGMRRLLRTSAGLLVPRHSPQVANVLRSLIPTLKPSDPNPPNPNPQPGLMARPIAFGLALTHL